MSGVCAHASTTEPTDGEDFNSASFPSCLSLTPDIAPIRSPERVFSDFLSAHYPSVFARYDVCREAPILFRCECGHGFRVPNSCGVRTCPDCGEFAEARLVKRYASAFRDLRRPDRVRLVTLTAAYPTISPASYRAVYRQFQEVLGLYWDTYLCSLQVSPKGMVHCHAMVYGDFVAQSELSDSAREVLGCPVVDIRRVYNVREAVRYVVRYAVRSPEFVNPKLRCDYFEATRRVRLVRSRGAVYGLGEKKPSFCCPDCGGALCYEGTWNGALGLSEWPLYSRSPVRPPDS